MAKLVWEIMQSRCAVVKHNDRGLELTVTKDPDTGRYRAYAVEGPIDTLGTYLTCSEVGMLIGDNFRTETGAIRACERHVREWLKIGGLSKHDQRVLQVEAAAMILREHGLIARA